MSELHKTVIPSNVLVQTHVCADPEIAVDVLCKDPVIYTLFSVITVTGDGTRYQAVRVVGMEGFLPGIETFQSLPLIKDPDLTGMIFVKSCDPVIGRCPVGFSSMVNLESIPVIAVEPILGTEPEKAEVIFNEGICEAVRKTIFKADPMKSNIVILGTDSSRIGCQEKDTLKFHPPHAAGGTWSAQVKIKKNPVKLTVICYILSLGAIVATNPP
jgi:hypothetical protein